jgi:hypothetical protein
MRGPSASDVSGWLAQRMWPLVTELLPAGRRAGPEWVAPSLAGTSRRGLSIRLSGEKAGWWKDFAGTAKGDALDLVATVLFAGDRSQAYRWSLRWLGIAETGPATPQRPVPTLAKDAAPHSGLHGRLQAAKWFFREAQEGIHNSPGGLYLSARLPGLRWQPKALRYHAALWNGEAQRNLPALLAAIVDHAGIFLGVHRIWIARDQDGVWRKAPLKNPKMARGRIAGGHVPLWRGASGLSLDQAPHGETVAISEGIETGLAVAIACPELRVVAAVSLSNLGTVQLPATVARVILLADEDDNEPARLALQRAAALHVQAGREVRIARPPVGKDFNDTLLHQDDAA